tara:strand:- start:196 stop:756 length:561 start_codon:yes stop_codon:yes gene_type:complete
MNKHLALFTFLLTLFSSLLSAEGERGLKSLEDYKHKYEAEWALLVSTLDAKKNLSFKKKLLRYEEEVSRLKQLFLVERVNEYEGLSTTLVSVHQCNGRPSGTPKNCGFVCVERPDENMYTTEEWVTFKGDSMGHVMTEAKACLKLEVRGKGRKKGSVSAIFKYRKSHINYKSAQDADILFNNFLTN